METNNWRNEESRQKIVNKIVDTLQRHMPVACADGMNELKKIALRFEEKIYTVAISQTEPMSGWVGSVAETEQQAGLLSSRLRQSSIRLARLFEKDPEAHLPKVVPPPTYRRLGCCLLHIYSPKVIYHCEKVLKITKPKYGYPSGMN